jgi:hydrogenase expression/formation protein HypD
VKYIDEFRDGALARRIADRIAAEAEPGRGYAFMEFCGGHTHAIARHGVADLLPPEVRLVHGPGCPVCVLPAGRIDQAIAIALERGATLCTYGDAMRAPGSGGMSLLQARARGADVRVVGSPADALRIAAAQPRREVVFLAIGFETTTPPSALAVLAARSQGLANVSFLCCHVLTPPAVGHLLAGGDGVPPAAIDGVIGPAHVSVVTGYAPFEPIARRCRTPVVIAGFEPLDVMQAVLMLVRQVGQDRCDVENEYTRAVSRQGNAAAQRVVAEVFERRASFEWRGLGTLPDSALQLRPAFAAFDAEQRHGVGYRAVPDHRQCECGEILRGRRHPTDCRLFGTACTPETPLGACMVSSEGACAAHWAYGRLRGVPVVAA